MIASQWMERHPEFHAILSDPSGALEQEFTPEKGMPLNYDNEEDQLDCRSNSDEDDEMDLLMREGGNVQRDMDDDLQQIKARLMRLVSKG